MYSAAGAQSLVPAAGYLAAMCSAPPMPWLTVSCCSATMAVGCGANSALLAPDDECTALTGQTACGLGWVRWRSSAEVVAGRL